MKPRPKPGEPITEIPPVRVVVRETAPSPAQAAAYRRLWDKLLAIEKEGAPAHGGNGRRPDDSGAHGSESPPNTG